jgi:hypothetical protein
MNPNTLEYAPIDASVQNTLDVLLAELDAQASFNFVYSSAPGQPLVSGIAAPAQMSAETVSPVCSNISQWLEIRLLIFFFFFWTC